MSRLYNLKNIIQAIAEPSHTNIETLISDPSTLYLDLNMTIYEIAVAINGFMSREIITISGDCVWDSGNEIEDCEKFTGIKAIYRLNRILKDMYEIRVMVETLTYEYVRVTILSVREWIDVETKTAESDLSLVYKRFIGSDDGRVVSALKQFISESSDGGSIHFSDPDDEKCVQFDFHNNSIVYKWEISDNEYNTVYYLAKILERYYGFQESTDDHLQSVSRKISTDISQVYQISESFLYAVFGADYTSAASFAIHILKKFHGVYAENMISVYTELNHFNPDYDAWEPGKAEALKDNKSDDKFMKEMYNADINKEKKYRKKRKVLFRIAIIAILLIYSSIIINSLI